MLASSSTSLMSAFKPNTMLPTVLRYHSTSAVSRPSHIYHNPSQSTQTVSPIHPSSPIAGPSASASASASYSPSSSSSSSSGPPISRATTTTPSSSELPPQARGQLERMIRVDQAGELGANWIYRGQKWGLGVRGDKKSVVQVDVSGTIP